MFVRYLNLKYLSFKKNSCITQAHFVAHAHFCKAEVWSAQQLWEARVCIAEAHGVRGFPPLSDQSLVQTIFHPNLRKISYSCYQRYNQRQYLSIFTALVKHHHSVERGKAGSHEPPLFTLPDHILAFFSSSSHEPPLFPLLYHHI